MEENIILNETTKNLHTINDMIRWVFCFFRGSKIFYGHGNDNPLNEAIQLVFTTINLPPNNNIPENIFNSRLTDTERLNIIKNSLVRVNKRIPVAYITNKAWFCGYEFYVDNRVLIPRSPIGELINNSFNGLISQFYPSKILDMCTGSGCIAITCAYNFSKSKIDAVDISYEALEVAKLNIKNHNLNSNITLLQSDLFNEIPKKKYDIIISNPPYVDDKTMLNLPNEYYYEPILGLLGGIDGLKFISRILSNCADYLNEHGILICEVGNCMKKLIKVYKNIPFIWLDFDKGGDGVFMLNYQEIVNSQYYFSYHKN